jgi:hypothetical protein
MLVIPHFVTFPVRAFEHQIVGDDVPLTNK